LPLALTGYCLGLTANRIAPFSGETSFWPQLLLASLLAAYLWRRTFLLRSPLLLPLLLSLFFLTGTVRQPRDRPPPPAGHAYYLFAAPKTVTIVGQIENSPTRNPNTVSCTASLLEVITDQHRQPAQGLIKLSLPAGDFPLFPGDHFMARAKVSRISSFANPGLFNYREYLAQKDILLQGWISSPLHLLKLETPLRSSPLQRLHFVAQGVRSSIGRFVDQNLNAEDAALYKALLIGERGSIPNRTIEAFKCSGTMHLLAISGLHIGILAFFCIFLFRWLLNLFPSLLQHYSAWKMASLLALLPLMAYAVIAGWQPPVVRALIMYCVVAGAVLFNRQAAIGNTVLLAAGLILAVSPASLFSISFQLSFSAVIAIVLASFRFPAVFSRPAAGTKAIKKFAHFIAGSLLVSIAASIGTAPMLLYYFHRLSLLSPFSTLLIAPLLCFFALPLGLLGCCCMPLAPHLARLLFAAGACGLHPALWLNSFFAALPLAEIHFFSPSPAEIFLFYCLAASLLFLSRIRFSRIGALSFLLLLTLSFATNYWRSRHSKETKMVFLDVGQGSAAVVHLPGGRTVLVDGGGSAWNNFDVGKDIIAPYLWNRRILRVDDIVLSHEHADHFNGLFYILEHFRPSRLWVHATASDSQEVHRLLELAKNNGVNVMVPTTIEGLPLDGETEIYLANAPEILRRQGANSVDSANTGLLTRIETKNLSVLLPGDLGRSVERLLVTALASFLPSDVLVASHHGSSGSNDALFLQRVHPRYIVISTGWQAEGIFENLGKRSPFIPKAHMYATSSKGAVSVRLGKDEIEIETVGKE